MPLVGLVTDIIQYKYYYIGLTMVLQGLPLEEKMLIHEFSKFIWALIDLILYLCIDLRW